MPVTTSEPTSSARDETPRRGRRWPLVLGGLGAVSVVFAGLVIFSSSTETSPRRDPVARVSASSEVLTVGNSNALTKIVVFEDFASPTSRTFEISSRDFLRDAAARGDVVVEYHPVVLVQDDYSGSAAGAWRVVADRGRPEQALVMHDLLFDQQSTANGPATREFIALAKQAGVNDAALLDAVGAAQLTPETGPAAGAAGGPTTPRVLVDRQPLTAASPVALADQLQRLVLDRTKAP